MPSSHRRINETYRERSQAQNKHPGPQYVKSVTASIGAQGHAPGMAITQGVAKMDDKPKVTLRPFQVDELIIWYSPFTETDMLVIYRGPFDRDSSVVYNQLSGWQGVVKNELLRHKEETK